MGTFPSFVTLIYLGRPAVETASIGLRGIIQERSREQ